MDRGHAELAARIDALHPAVLQADRARRPQPAARPARPSPCAAASPPIRPRCRLLIGPRRARDVGRAGGGAGGQAPRPHARDRGVRRARAALPGARVRRRGPRAGRGRRCRRSGGCTMNEAILGHAATRPRADAADRGVADRGLLLRLGQPDLLGWRRWRRRAMRSSRTSECCSRSASRSGSRARTTARRDSRRSSCYLVTTRGVEMLMAVPPGVTAGLDGRGARAGRIGLQGARTVEAEYPGRAPLRHHRRHRLQPLQQHQAAELPELLRRPALRRDRHRPRRARARGVIGSAWPVLEHGMDATSQAILGAGSARPVRLRRPQPHPDRHRACTTSSTTSPGSSSATSTARPAT